MKNHIHFIILFAFLIFGFLINKLFTFTYITAEFDELRPIKGFMPVYYKGIIVGRAKEAKHSNDFKHSLIRLVLYPKNLLLPTNTTVQLKKEKKKHKEIDFLELIYPDEPTLVMLSNHSKIKGTATLDTETFLANQHPDDLEQIKENLMTSAQNLSYALSALGEIFDNVNIILKENQKNIYQTTKNVENMTLKVNKAIKQQQLENTLSNIETSTNSIVSSLNSLNNTIPNVDSSLNQTKEMMCNLNAISCGVRKTLSKNFSLIKLFFGRVID